MGDVVGYGLERGVATLTLDSPHNRNALSRQLVAELHDGLDRAEADAARAVVLAHTGPAFCAGADLKERAAGPPDSRPFVDVLRRLMDTDRPTIAAVDGAVRAGGIGLMAACDVVVVRREVTFALTEVRIGVAAAIIAVPILRRVAAPAITTAMLTGAPFDADAARSMHLVDVVTDDVGASVTEVLVGMLAGAPGAVAATKRLLHRVPTLPRDDAFAEMQALSEALFAGADAQEGMAAFAEKRSPAWAVTS